MTVSYFIVTFHFELFLYKNTPNTAFTLDDNLYEMNKLYL